MRANLDRPTRRRQRRDAAVRACGGDCDGQRCGQQAAVRACGGDCDEQRCGRQAAGVRTRCAVEQQRGPGRPGQCQCGFNGQSYACRSDRTDKRYCELPVLSMKSQVQESEEGNQ